MDVIATLNETGNKAVKFLASEFSSSLTGRWRECLVEAYKFLSELVSTQYVPDDAMCVMLNAAVTSIQTVRVSPTARGKLLNDALCPKPYTAEILLFVLLGLIDTLLLRCQAEQHTQESTPCSVFTGSRQPNELSDIETFICAKCISHEVIDKLDFSDNKVWKEYTALESRFYKLVLYTDENEMHHSLVFQSGNKKTVLIHTIAAITAALWRRRLSHKILSCMRGSTSSLPLCDNINDTKLVQLMRDAYSDWIGVRFKQTIQKGRANALCRIHDTEVFSFLASGIAGTKASLSESVDAGFLCVPHVLTTIYGNYDALQLRNNDPLHDNTIVLYLANSLIKQRFGIALADQYILIEADIAKSVQNIASSRYRAPLIIRAQLNEWGVLHFLNDTPSFVLGSILNAEYPLVGCIGFWIHCHAAHLMKREVDCRKTALQEFIEFARTLRHDC